MASDKVSVLFVCTGNICRSPAGEGVFRFWVEQQGLGDRFHIESAGTIGYHAGELPDERMRAAAAQRGYVLDSIARQVRAADLQGFDVIIAMDRDHLRALEAMAGAASPHIRMLGSFLDAGGSNAGAPSVPDPYYGGRRGFENVLDMIEAACPALLAHCLRVQAPRP